MQDQRKDSKRVPFSEEDGVLCVVIKPEPSGGAFYLQALDVSENGIKFKTAPESEHGCSIWDTLFLAEIVGERRLKFAEPIELVVKWQENEVDQCVFGCQIRHATPESKNQFVDFVRSEMKIGGVGNLSRLRPASSTIDNEKEEEEMAALEERMRSTTTAAQPRTRLLAFAGLLLLMGILLATVFVTCSQNRNLARRMDRLEEQFRLLPAPAPPMEAVQNQLSSIEESLAGLSDLAQQNRALTQSLTGRIKTLEEKAAEAAKAAGEKTRPAPAAPAPAEQKAAPQPKPAPPKKSAAAEPGSGSVHVVEKGENLFRISVKYSVPMQRLAEINGMKVNDPIYPGQKIKLP